MYKRYHISVLILSFAISVQNTANMRKWYTTTFAYSYCCTLYFWIKSVFSFPISIKSHKNFIANERNIMQALSECLELIRSLNSFTLGNQTKQIMKTSADKGKSEGGNNMPRPRKASSKNSEIEAYLSSRYEFRYNTVLGRTEYRRMNSSDFTKVGRYEINTLRREIDNDIGIITSSKIYTLSSRAASLHASTPYWSISRDCHWWM